MSEQWQQFLGQHNAPRQDAKTNWFCDLSSWSILSVQEGDPSRFLQGQLSCDVDQVTDTQNILGACCNAKGRMFSNFRIMAQPQGFGLIMKHCLIDDNIATLDKYAVFFRSKLTNQQSNLVGIGICGEQAAEQLKALGATLPGENGTTTFRDGTLICVDQANARFQVWLDVEQASLLWLELKQAINQAPSDYWELADIRQGIAWVTAETKEKYTPHQFNLQALGAISFKKGCYTGQEIVARMQHLGKLKNRLYPVTYSTISEDPAGQQPTSIINDAGKIVGEIIVQATNESGTSNEALAVIRNDAAIENNLKHDLNGSVTLRDLPYAITNKEHLNP